MSTPQVSIIIPVYNAEATISKCLDSLIHQTLTDIEIICVDDCSTDNTPNILNKYAKADSRVIIRKTAINSGGPSVPKSLGLKYAKGEYVGFIDNDDYVDINYYQVLYNLAKSESADIAETSNVQTLRENTWIKSCHYKNCYSTDEEKIFYFLVRGVMWNKIYKLDLIKNNNIKIIQPTNYVDDNLWVFDTVFCANKIVSTDETSYYYILHQNCLTIKRPDKFYYDVLIMVNIVNSKLNMLRASKDTFFYFYQGILNTLFNYLKNLYDYGKSELFYDFCIGIQKLKDDMPYLNEFIREFKKSKTKYKSYENVSSYFYKYLKSLQKNKLLGVCLKMSFYEKVRKLICETIYKNTEFWIKFQSSNLKKLNFKIKGKHNVILIQSKGKVDKKSNIKIIGNNNVICIGKNFHANKFNITCVGDNSYFFFDKNIRIDDYLNIFQASGNKIVVGEETTFCNVDIQNIHHGRNIKIGKDCMLSFNINMYNSDGHPIYNGNIKEIINKPTKDLVLGEHVWVGMGSYILKGVNIADGCIIGKGSVVTKSFTESNTVIAGNPAKICKKDICWSRDDKEFSK